MKGFAKRPRVDVAPGERVLAWTEATTGEVLAGTREALYLGGTRLAWEDVEAADWDRETEVFRVIEVGTWGEVRAEHRFAIGEPRRLLELVRERVTASVLLVRHVPLEGRRAMTGACAGSTSTTQASTPATRWSGWPPRTPWRTPAAKSGWISRALRALLICAGFDPL